MRKPKISFVLPTRNRCGRTLKTLSILEQNVTGVLHEVIVIDNASSDGTAEAIARDFPQVRLIELSENLNTAARNLGVSAADSPLVFMLDDDSWPEKGTTEEALRVMAREPRLAAAACYVRRYGRQTHEMGGLPGAFLGGGVVLRREAMLEIGGYPVDYGYYVEEYDIAARLWQAGWQVKWFESMQAWHDPDTAGRDMNRILKMLTANNLRFWSRYAPVRLHEAMIQETIERYRKIAEKEGALAGYQEGLKIGLEAVWRNNTRRRPLTDGQFDSLFGLDHVRRQLQQLKAAGVSRLLLWRRGKAAEQILDVVGEAGLTVTAMAEDTHAIVENDRFSQIPAYSPQDAGTSDAQAALIGSLSPGVSVDLLAEARSHLAGLEVVDPVARQVREAVVTAA